MAYLFSLHTWELNFGQTICDRAEVLLGISYGDNLRTWENPMGTHWEQGEKPKYKPPPPPSTPPSIFKRKKVDPFMRACSEIVGHSVSIETPKGHIPMAEGKWLVQRTWIQAINNVNMMSHMQICTNKMQQL
jgi:hypothetical protein